MTKKSNRTPPRRATRLVTTNIDSIDEAADRQADMLRRLKHAGTDLGYYVGLEDCGPNDCGRVKCAEACWFGARRRRLKEISSVWRLLQQFQGPLYEMRIIRESWRQPIDHLMVDSIAIAKQFNRRRLDTLYSPLAVAIGTFKVSVAPRYAGTYWIGEIHQIVAGVEKEELEGAFSVKRASPGYSNIFWARAVTDLANTVSDILRRDLLVWQQPFTKETGPRANKTERAEFYRWLLRLRPEQRLVRYGCDKHFNQLLKKPRVFRPKATRKRPYPVWLAPYMFGSHPMTCKCDMCMKGTKGP
jgi:hypothetical protein